MKIWSWLSLQTVAVVTGALKLVRHYKIMDIGSELPFKLGSCKLYMRGPNPEPHTPWLDLEQHPL